MLEDLMEGLELRKRAKDARFKEFVRIKPVWCGFMVEERDQTYGVRTTRIIKDDRDYTFGPITVYLPKDIFCRR